MKTKLSSVFGVMALLLGGMFFHSCGTGGDDDSDEAETSTVQQEEKVAVTRPNVVKVYIDASGSMRDYFGKIDISTISDALTSIEQIPDSFKVEYFVWGVPPTPIKRDELTQKLVTKDLTGKATVFDKILEPMAKVSSKDTLAVLITDGIISSSSAQTNISRNFTDYDKGHLVNNIQRALQGKGKAVSLYRMIGAFDGTYYDKSNKKVPYKGNRPFFVLVMGQPENVRYFDSEARNGNVHDVYKNAEAIHIGTAPSKMAFRLEPVSGSDNMADFENFNRQEGSSTYNYPGELGFRVAAAIPGWVMENYSEKTILAMSEILLDGKKLNVRPRIDNGRIVFDVPEEVARKHNLSGEQYTVTYRMTDPSADAWTVYSTEQDSVIDPETTYLLDDLIKAIRKGILGNDTGMLESSVTIIPFEE